MMSPRRPRTSPYLVSHVKSPRKNPLRTPLSSSRRTAHDPRKRSTRVPPEELKETIMGLQGELRSMGEENRMLRAEITRLEGEKAKETKLFAVVSHFFHLFQR